MSSSENRQSESENAICFYSRKDKSLGLLCTKFLKLYNRDGIESIGLDSAAIQLGVERRRIYDIVNILESIGVLVRKAKNQYTWKGFTAIPQALDVLKQEGLREKCNSSNKKYFIKNSNENQYIQIPKLNTDRQENDFELNKVDNRREKSLGLLTGNFVKLLLCSDVELISLDYAASALLGENCDSNSMRTKVRRLYDIANVFASMNLIEKVRHPESGKPAFRWIGVEGSSKNQTSISLNENNSKKRIFGTEITNTVSKRYKVDCSSENKAKENSGMPLIVKYENLKDKNISTEQHPKHGSKGFVFGPFSPVSTLKAGVPGKETVREAPDWENLASSYQPQYCNQGTSGDCISK